MATTKFDIKIEAARPLYVGVGITDLAVEAVRDYVADVQKRFVDVQKTVTSIDFQPVALRETIEARVAELQADAKELPAKVTDVYTDLAKRGETLVTRIRKQESTKATKTAAKTTTAKAKTTKTQAAKTTKTAAKKTTTAAKKTAKTSSAPSSAKATTTAAKTTASNATAAVADAAQKIGD